MLQKYSTVPVCGNVTFTSWDAPGWSVMFTFISYWRTAAIVLQLVEEGRIRLDAPVTDYLPELTLAKGVTVQQLLSHTSGIADLLAPMRDRLNADPHRAWTPAEAYRSTHAALEPRYGSFPIFEHTMPFNVQRAWDELEGGA